MTQEARRRIKAIEEFSDLGSGFNIAMQDLDIRGAGNLLGGEQSGFISDVGFETYQRILKEAIDELKANELRGVIQTEEKDSSLKVEDSYITDCHIETDLEIMLPESYVSNISERIRLYKELNEIKEEEELNSFEIRLKDRFGAMPESAVELFNLVRLRWFATKMGVEKLVLKKSLMLIHFTSNIDSGFYNSELFISIINYVNRLHDKIKVKQSEERLSLNVKGITNVSEAINVFNKINSFHNR